MSEPGPVPGPRGGLRGIVGWDLPKNWFTFAAVGRERPLFARVFLVCEAYRGLVVLERNPDDPT